MKQKSRFEKLGCPWHVVTFPRRSAINQFSRQTWSSRLVFRSNGLQRSRAQYSQSKKRCVYLEQRIRTSLRLSSLQYRTRTSPELAFLTLRVLTNPFLDPRVQPRQTHDVSQLISNADREDLLSQNPRQQMSCVHSMTRSTLTSFFLRTAHHLVPTRNGNEVHLPARHQVPQKQIPMKITDQNMYIPCYFFQA